MSYLGIDLGTSGLRILLTTILYFVIICSVSTKNKYKQHPLCLINGVL